MIIVMFEVELFDGCKEEYHALGRNLQASLQKQKGFLGGKTYICEDNPNREVSINYWDNEDAVMEWRNFLGH
ncbi:hypothetical protein OBV_29030 [Oscillibacter valericigenes Sjm18-20]|nr:hypothetical protein OBV_29030 [Oscillibacter valericigenes Sjm18-20]